MPRAAPRRCLSCGRLWREDERVEVGYAGGDGVPGTDAHMKKVRARRSRRKSKRCPACASGGRWSGGSKVWTSMPVLMYGEMKVVRASDKEWRRFRAGVIEARGGLCERCGAVGTEVHHVDGTRYDLGLDMEGRPIRGGRFDEAMVELLCHECHELETVGG